MNRKVSLLFTTLIIASLWTSCRKDDDLDGAEGVPLRDRVEEAAESQAEIEEFLRTHFYNYEEFENPTADFDYRIVIDTLAGDNLDKTPLMEQVRSKPVNDPRESGFMYTLYYLVVNEGGGDEISFADTATLRFEGRHFTEEVSVSEYFELFSSSATPINFDLTGVVNGFQDALVEFRGAASQETNPDGSITFEDFGIGAVFVPSGLGYFADVPPSSGIPLYAQLVFTFNTYARQVGDQDQDGIPSVFEDLNGNQTEEDDDTDGDGNFNIFDADDDNDGRPTRDEIIINTYTFTEGEEPTLNAAKDEVEVAREVNTSNNTITITTIIFDDDENGVRDHLDAEN